MGSKDKPRREPKKPRVKGKRPLAMKNGSMETDRVGPFLIEMGYNHDQRQYYVQVVRIRSPQPTPSRLRVKFGPTYYHTKLTRCDMRRHALRRELAIKAALETMGLDDDGAV